MVPTAVLAGVITSVVTGKVPDGIAALIAVGCITFLIGIALAILVLIRER